jgi:hypothetical protein
VHAQWFASRAGRAANYTVYRKEPDGSTGHHIRRPVLGADLPSPIGSSL